MRMPGPIVDDSVTLLRYLPFAAAGLAFTMLSTSACVLAISDSAGNEVFPTGAWMMPVLSTRNSTLPALISLTALRDLERDGAGLRVRHQAARAEHLAETADRAHHVGRRDDGVEIHPAAVDLLDDFFAGHVIGAGVLRFLLLLAAGDHQHFLALAETVRQHDGAAHHLVGVLRIDAETGRQLDGLIELCEFDFLEQGNCILDRQRMLRNLLLGGFELLTQLLPPVVQTGRLHRALPLSLALSTLAQAVGIACQRD